MSGVDALSFDRYTEQPFPPYRFLPGRDPHPTADPAGHSYVPPGEAEPAVVYVPPERWFESPDYLYAADLYNHGYWWEAHEAWEGLWQLTDKSGVQGRFLQGLIQTAAMHLKFLQRHDRGFRRLRASSRAYLETAMPMGRYMGLDVPAFMASVDAYYGRLARGGSHDAGSFPFVRLAVPTGRGGA